MKIKINSGNKEGGSALELCMCQDLTHVLCMQGKDVEAIVVTGEQVASYAVLAAQTALRRMRPVSKQVNLGPKRVERCGWGGGTSPLEALSIQHRQQMTHNS